MTIEFTNEQYRTLLKALYWAEWVKSAMLVPPYDEETNEIQALEQHVFSHAAQFGIASDWIVYDEKDHEYFPNPTMENALQIVIDKYNDDNFWYELIHRLSERDVYEQFGESVKGNLYAYWEKEGPILKKYGEEFATRGLERLHIID